PDDHQVHAHRLDVLGRVNERFALGKAGAGRGEVNGVGREPFGSQAKARPRPGRRLEEEVDDDLALQLSSLVARYLAEGGELLGIIKNRLDLGPAEFFQAEQVAMLPGSRAGWRRGSFDGHDMSPCASKDGCGS